MKRAYLFGLLALLGGVGLVAAVYRGTADSPKPQALPLTREQLVRLGLRLGPPDPDQPVVPRARAVRAARSAMPSRVRGSVLATCYDSDEEVGYPCWVVSHDPTGYRSSGPPGAPRVPASYVVSIIDSRTGALIGSRMGGGGGRASSSAPRAVAKEAVEQAIREWTRGRVDCRDNLRPDFRGRPSFGCTVRSGGTTTKACYAVLGRNLFRMGCSTPRTDLGKLVYRGGTAR